MPFRIDRFTPRMTVRLAFLSMLLLVTGSLAAAEQRPETVTLTISGMHCESCATGIVAMLKRTDGVVKADVSYEERRASVTYDATKTSPEKIVEAIEKLGYKAAVKKS